MSKHDGARLRRIVDRRKGDVKDCGPGGGDRGTGGTNRKPPVAGGDIADRKGRCTRVRHDNAVPSSASEWGISERHRSPVDGKSGPRPADCNRVSWGGPIVHENDVPVLEAAGRWCERNPERTLISRLYRPAGGAHGISRVRRGDVADDEGGAPGIRDRDAIGFCGCNNNVPVGESPMICRELGARPGAGCRDSVG